jgi:hypothetical protein
VSFLARLGRSLLAGAATYTVSRTIQIIADRPHRVAHEAGHALLFWRSPYTEFEHVALRFNLFSLTAGLTSAKRRVPLTRDYFLDAAIISMGGLGGELVGRGRCEPEGGRMDIAFAKRCLFEALGPSTPMDHMLRQTTAAAYRRLANDRPAYERLRTALDAHGELEAPQMTRILGLPAARGGRGALDVSRRRQ